MGAGPDAPHPADLCAGRGVAVYQFSSHTWAGDIDVPTAVIIPRRDRVVPPTRQHTLAAAVPDAVTYDLDGDHGVFLTAPDRLLTALRTTCHQFGTPAHTAADPGPAGQRLLRRTCGTPAPARSNTSPRTASRPFDIGACPLRETLRTRTGLPTGDRQRPTGREFPRPSSPGARTTPPGEATHRPTSLSNHICRHETAGQQACQLPMITP